MEGRFINVIHVLFKSPIFFNTYYDRYEDMNSKPKLFKQFAVPLFPYNVKKCGKMAAPKEIGLCSRKPDTVNRMLYYAYLVYIVICLVIGWVRESTGYVQLRSMYARL